MPQLYPNLTRAAYWIIGILGAAILFVSVLLHELSHSLLSQRYGLRVQQIMLFVFGGVSEIKEESKDYKEEFKIAIVGPLSSLALAGIFASIWFLLAMANVTGPPGGEKSLFYFPSAQPQREQGMGAEMPAARSLTEPAVMMTIVEGTMRYAAITNIMLGLFNLIPAFPLDGGRVLRAVLMMRRQKNYEEATKIAVKVGVGISYAIMAFGFITVFTGSFIGGFWLILIGWFLQSGAQSYLRYQEITSALSNIHLRDVMNTRFIALSPDMTVKDAIDRYFNVYRKSELPVVEKGSGFGDKNYYSSYYYLVGAVTADSIFNIRNKNRENVKVADIMIQKRELVIMRPSDTADYALRKMMQDNKGRIYVCENVSPEHAFASKNMLESTTITHKEYDAATTNISGKRYDRLIGLISKTDILNIARERLEYAESFQKFGRDMSQSKQSDQRIGEDAT